MAENLIVDKSLSKKERYQTAVAQIRALVSGESNITANLANISAALKQSFDFFWVGFYLVDKTDELVLGPFQGPIACTRIKKGKGVCGTAWEEAKTIIVPDVDKFPGHIACASESKSEIVVPFFDKAGKCLGVLDVDQDHYDAFDETDKEYLEQLLSIFSA